MRNGAGIVRAHEVVQYISFPRLFAQAHNALCCNAQMAQQVAKV